MKKFFTKWKWLPIASGIVFMLVGLAIAICVWIPTQNPDGEVAQNIGMTLGYIIASLLMLIGVGTLTLSLLQKPMKLDIAFLISVIITSLAGYLYYLVATNHTAITDIIIIQGVIFILAIALFVLVWSIRKLIPKSKKVALPVLAIIGAAILIGGGITLITMRADITVQHIAVCIMGVVIFAIGLYTIIYYFKHVKEKGSAANKVSNKPQKKAAESEATEHVENRNVEESTNNDGAEALESGEETPGTKTEESIESVEITENIDD